MSEFSHLEKDGTARMVDVTAKEPTHRMARARAKVRTRVDVVARIKEMKIAKGPVLETARIAGIQAAKRTAELIPLCHPLPIDAIDVQCRLGEDTIEIEATVKTFARTGVEMEALCAASVAALTVYDMCKAVDRSMNICEVKLMEKTGGTRGDYLRGEDPDGGKP